AFFFLYVSGDLPALPSFPTRRSSDLAFVRRLYRYGLKFLFHPVALGLSVVFALAGIAAFVSNVHSDRFNLTGQSLALGFLILLRSEEHTSELQSRGHLVCRLLLEKKN